MLPGWPQCTSQPGRSHDFTSSTNGANTAVTGSAVHQASETAGERAKPSAPTTGRTRAEKETESKDKASRPYVPPGSSAASRRG